MFLKIVVFSFCFLVVRSASVKQLEFSSSSQIQNEQNVNPELLGGGVEGDMIFPPQSATTRGVAIRGLFRRWPDAVIPFDFSRITNSLEREQIQKAMTQVMYDVGTPIPGQIARRVCVYFRPAVSTDTEVLLIQNGNGCSASVGFFPNHQKVLTLQSNGCFQNGIIQHELLHVLGFFHEQSRPDRDSFITVHQENIEDGQQHNFNKFQWDVDVENQSFTYDYGSIMHYPTNAFSKNLKPTITPKQANVSIGQRNKLSPTDIAEIRHYYEC